MGKTPTQDKIRKIIKEANPEEKATTISMNQFVEYMINKQKLKLVSSLWDVVSSLNSFHLGKGTGTALEKSC